MKRLPLSWAEVAMHSLPKIGAPLALVLVFLAACDGGHSSAADAQVLPDAAVGPGADAAPDDPALAAATRLLDEGRQTFRYGTFGDEAFWGGALGLHRA